MSTRCNISVTDQNGDTEYLYRHHDGYLSQTGRDIVRKLAANQEATADELLDVFLADSDNYERTNAAHGDIEHFYAIAVCPVTALRIGHAAGYGPGLESEAIFAHTDLSSFRRKVTKGE